MAKFVMEFDTDEETTSFTIDGVSIDPDSASIGFYTSCWNEDKTPEKCSYISVSVKQDENTTTSYSYSYSDKSKVLESLSLSKSIASQVKKIVEDSKVAQKLIKAISKKDPIKTFDLSHRANNINPQPVIDYDIKSKESLQG